MSVLLERSSESDPPKFYGILCGRAIVVSMMSSMGGQRNIFFFVALPISLSLKY